MVSVACTGVVVISSQGKRFGGPSSESHTWLSAKEKPPQVLSEGAFGFVVLRQSFSLSHALGGFVSSAAIGCVIG